MRSDVRLRADLVGNLFVTDAEINEYLNQGIAEFYDRLVGARGQEYVAIEQTITTTGVEAYALPANHYETIYVELDLGGPRTRLTSYSMHERAGIIGSTTNGTPIAFRLQNANISFLPAPTAGFTIRHWYQPASPRLVTDGDSVDGVDGWEEYAIWRSVAYCQQKEQLDPSFAMGMVQQIGGRIDRLAPFRATNNTERVTDVYRSRAFDMDPSRYLPRP
ncbi:MAG: hypothetical protein WCJ30_09750 [Deltaproteobacteria bacterium]